MKCDVTQNYVECEIFCYVSLSTLKSTCPQQLGGNPLWNLHSQSYTESLELFQPQLSLTEQPGTFLLTQFSVFIFSRES